MTDRAWWDGDPSETPQPRYDGFERTSIFVPMTDGVRLATDLYLPKGLEGTVPAIIVHTPYYRSFQLASPDLDEKYPALAYHGDLWGPRFSPYGYAVLVIEMRGAGASFGTRSLDPRPDGGRDDVDIIDWIVAQPWSNGRVGATGISAPGLAAIGSLSARHPALKAIAPLFTAYDAFSCTHPGGVPIVSFVSIVGDGTRLLDSNKIRDLPSIPAELHDVLVGLRPVDEDRDGSLLAAAVEEHKDNVYLDRALNAVTYRDDALPGSATRGQEVLDQDRLLVACEEADTAIFGYGGWYDGTLGDHMAAVFNASKHPGSRMMLGPWYHGGYFNCSPAIAENVPTEFDHTREIIRFFDQHLRDDGRAGASEAPVRYFTMGEERWKSATAWPPPGARTQSLYLGAGGGLSSEPGEGTDTYDVDFDAGVGPSARWSLSRAPVRYLDRATRDKQLLTYTSTPLDADLEVTGNPVATLRIATTSTDGIFAVLLEDVDPSGEVRFVTDGVIRGMFRSQPMRGRYFRSDAAPLVPGEVNELVIELIGVSWMFRAGHSIRVALAGADKDSFPRIPETGPVTWTVHHSSRIDLPVMP